MKNLTNFILEADTDATTPDEYFGTIMQSIVEVWKAHFMTSEYTAHMALDEYYKEMPEKADEAIEAFMSVNGKFKAFKNNILLDDFKSVVEYLDKLHEFVHAGYEQFTDESEIQSALDNVLEQIDSTLYKLKELN